MFRRQNPISLDCKFTTDFYWPFPCVLGLLSINKSQMFPLIFDWSLPWMCHWGRTVAAGVLAFFDPKYYFLSGPPCGIFWANPQIIFWAYSMLAGKKEACPIRFLKLSLQPRSKQLIGSRSERLTQSPAASTVRVWRQAEMTAYIISIPMKPLKNDAWQGRLVIKLIIQKLAANECAGCHIRSSKLVMANTCPTSCSDTWYGRTNACRLQGLKQGHEIQALWRPRSIRQSELYADEQLQLKRNRKPIKTWGRLESDSSIPSLDPWWSFNIKINTTQELIKS